MRDVPEDVYAKDLSYAVTQPDASSSDTEAGPPPQSSPSTTTGTETAADSGAATPLSSGPPNAECDLSGRWLVTERRVATGLGVQQAGLYWLYLDLAQSGDQITVNKGLICGTVVQPIGPLSASVDMHGCWPSLMSDNPLDGATASVSANTNGCDLKLDRYYAVFGATADYYRDPSVPMPTVDEEANGQTPGWVDCDQDGMPGATLHVSGIATGTRAESIRTWGQYEGTVPKGASTFKVPMDWGQDEAVLAVSSDVMKATGVKDGDRSLHFAQFARLSDDQAAASDDATLCDAIRKLAVQLTPDANE